MVTREIHSRSSFERYSAAAAKITILLALLALVGLFAHGYMRRKSRADGMRPGARGALMPSIAGVDFEAKEKTLILALNVNCVFCEKSLPFYERLLKNEQRQGYRSQTVAVFPNKEAEVVDYVRLNRLRVKAIPDFDFSSIGVGGTPTLLLVNEDGTLINSWAGQLSGEGEEEVLRAINSE
jgi:hypothetical protein